MKFKLLLMFHLVCFVSNVIAFELPQALRPLQSSMETSSATSAHSRKARFLGTTTTVTTTLSTTTACYALAGSPTTACAKKKRSISDDPISAEEYFADLVLPSSVHRGADPSVPVPDPLESVQDPLNAKTDATSSNVGLNQVYNRHLSNRVRGARIFYFYTTTTTSTITTFTKTTTFTLTACTPAGSFPFAVCG